MRKNEWLRLSGSIVFFIGIQHLLFCESDRPLVNSIFLFSTVMIILSIIPSHYKHSIRIIYLHLSLMALCIFTILRFFLPIYIFTWKENKDFWRVGYYEIGLLALLIGTIVLIIGTIEYFKFCKRNDACI